MAVPDGCALLEGGQGGSGYLDFREVFHKDGFQFSVFGFRLKSKYKINI
jgi:hypothetical protein